MDIKPIYKNRVFQAVAVGVVAATVLTVGIGAVIGTAIKGGLMIGAGYLAYKYVIEPMLENKKLGGLSKDEIRQRTPNYYDKDEVAKQVKAKTFRK